MHRTVIITEWSRKTFFSRLICLLALSIFVACSNIELIKPTNEGMVLSGKLFISFADERWALRYRFVGTSGDGILYFRSLGGLVQNQVRIEQDQLFIYDPKSKGMTRYSNRMMERDFGVSLPLEAMTFWVVGKPIPKQKYQATVIDTEGALVSFEQSGWTIFYDRFIASEDKNIPKKIKASSGHIEVILTIDT